MGSREEAALAHHALGVERPALAEVGRAVDLAQLARVDLVHRQVPVMAGVGLVHGRRRDAAEAVRRQALLDLFLGRAVGGVWARRSGRAEPR